MPVSLRHPDEFVRRHVGPRQAEVTRMLETVRAPSLDALIDETVPKTIRLGRALDLPAALSESALLRLADELASKNQVKRSLLGMGYADTITPPVILRNVLENPGWYTQYTPYQAEIAQGRLEALLNFQTLVTDLTGLPVANASLLDEATAAAEAMHLAHAAKGSADKNVFFVADDCHPQVIEVVTTRARALGHEVRVGSVDAPDLAGVFGALASYPGTRGDVRDLRDFGAKAKAAGALFAVAADLLSLALLVPPGELGADVAVGSSQRFGVPLGYGGPHAAYFATTEEHVRRLPGRIIGVSVDASGKRALRMALQTREQHIRRERATSNICTAQALLAVVASMYAVYHGPDGVKAIAERVHGLTVVLAAGLRELGVEVVTTAFFDTVTVRATSPQVVDQWFHAANGAGFNLRRLSPTELGVALDEVSSPEEVAALFRVFGADKSKDLSVHELAGKVDSSIPSALRRTSEYLTHPVFSQHRSETEMLRYLRTLESRDLSLCHAMIPLGSCTMKLNATAEMMPVTDRRWGGLHPFAPVAQAEGYQVVFRELEAALAEVTGFAAVSLQPNAGSQGEYAGLLAIRSYLDTNGGKQRTKCLIPQSAHGTNPASAVMAGFEVVVVACDAKGNVELADLEAKAKQHADTLGALMITYPSTHGVFEEDVKRICEVVHAHGGQVYMDGANMNAQVGLCRPGDIGADVCHLNLHKTFCIPHGGGGPGMGPIGVAAHLAPHLPQKPVLDVGNAGATQVGAVSAAPWGSASILLISWAYVRMMGPDGLREATRMAILNANYVAERLAPHFPVVYRGAKGRVAHECILDVRPFKKSAGIEVEDVAKRLIDYGFHAPTMSFPIPGTLMVEPTESEPLSEIDRFCEAMIAIREEIRAIEEGRLSREDNPLKNAPHTAEGCIAETWTHPYTRELALYPTPATRARKFFPPVARLNNAYGDRNLVCTCPPLEDYETKAAPAVTAAAPA